MKVQKLDFGELAGLRLFLRELHDRQIPSLAVYHDAASGGFYHRHDLRPAGKFSKSSTATCVLSLVATHNWAISDAPWSGSTSKLANGLLKTEWKTGGLETDNLFTVAFILEAATDLAGIASDAPDLAEKFKVELEPEAKDRLAKAEKILRDATSSGPKALSLLGYPPSAYVAQLVIRTLKKRPDGFTDTDNKISEWAAQEINKQFALISRGDKTADVFQLAYALILLVNLIEPARVTPDQEFIIDTALSALFDKQREDGTWPLSRPLFHYPEIGNAHCFDYEMLVQLLSEQRLSEKLLPFIPRLQLSATALRSYFPLGTGEAAIGRGWSSGHHPQLSGPESWSTASVYHFAHVLERLLAEQIRIETFAYLGTSYAPPRAPAKYADSLGDDFLDCELRIQEATRSLKDVVTEKILRPLIADEKRHLIERGSELSDDAPVSMIFFGPPGTSKTDLAKRIARILGWPRLTIDASQFLKKGMDGVYAEADTIFGMLAITERVVVLLDEFDEMVRAREKTPDVLSRFLTTAMLPKLHKIHDNRRLVLIVATNHIDWFDVAIRRPGRFDVVLQIMPPTAAAKLANKEWPELTQLEDAVSDDAVFQKELGALTFLETEILVKQLATASVAAERARLLKEQYDGCTMRSEVVSSDDDTKMASSDNTDVPNDNAERWEDLCKEQSIYNRLS